MDKHNHNQKNKRWTALTPSRQLAKFIGPSLIGRLSEDAYLAIYFHLPLADISSLARCCRKFAALAKDERVWSRKLACLDWSGPPPKDAQKLLERRISHARAKSEQNGLPSSTSSSPNIPASPITRQLATTSSSKNIIPSDADDGFGDFVDFSLSHKHISNNGHGTGHANINSQFDSVSLDGPFQRKEEDLLMLFDDDIDDMRMATASPAKKMQSPSIPQQPIPPAMISTSSSIPDHSTGTLYYGTPAPSHDLFVAYYENLLPFFKSLQSQTTSSLIFTRPTLTPHIRAELLSNLSRFLLPPVAPSRSSSTLTLVRRNLQSASDYFEAGMLAQFEKAAAGNILHEMREIAKALWELNGGQSVVQVFFNKVSLFYDASWDPLRNLTKSETLSGESVDGIDFSAMDAFMNHILAVVKKEGSVIAKVFPQDSDVLVLFADKVAIDVIDEYIIPLLSASQNLTSPLFLLTTAATFGQCYRLVDVIKDIQPASTAVTKEKVEQVIFRLFEQHMDDYLQEEANWVKKLLITICREWDKKLADDQANIDPTFLASQNPQQVKKNVLAGFTKALLLPVTIVPMTVALSVNAITYGGTMALNAMSGTYGSSMIYGSSPKVGTTPTLSHEKGSPTATIRQNNSNLVVNGRAKESNLTSLPLTPNSSTMSYYSSKSTVRQTGFQMLLSIDTAMQLIQADRDCLKRIQTFQGYTGLYGTKVKDAIEEVFIILCQTLSGSHLQPAFQKATDQMGLYKPADHDYDESVTPLVQFFELVHIGDTIAQMVQVYYDRELARYVDRNDFLSVVVREKKKFENALDEAVASGLNAGVHILMTQAEYILQTQQDPRDFSSGFREETGHDKRRASAVVMDIEGPTKTAEAVVDCLKTHCDMLKGSTDKAILEVFHQEVGLRLHAILLKHLKKTIVSIPGGFQVIADLNIYTSFVMALKVPNVQPYFTALKMAANVFIIDSPKDLGVMARDLERYEGTLRIEDIMEMVQCRTDWKRIEREVEKEVFGFKAEDCNVQ